MNTMKVWGAAAFALALAMPPTQSVAQASAGPFAALAGSWSGGGTITMSNGEQERLQCRARYAVAGGGDNLSLNIRCASDSYRFDLASNVANRGGRISGEWSEASHNAAGTLVGRASPDRIQVQANSPSFSAHLTLTTRGNRQSVAIQPQGTAVQIVALTLSRR